MQVQMIENWAVLEGEVQAVAPAPEMPGFDVVELVVHAVRDVPGYRNLFAKSAGETLRVHVPHESAIARGLAPGVRVTCRVRKASPSAVFVNPREIETR
jgi:hypothetical protein